MSTKPPLRAVKIESETPSNRAGSGAPRPPAGLKAAGKRLWVSVVTDWELDDWETATLLQACRCADRLDELAVIASREPAIIVTSKGDSVPHPALRESRAQAIILTRLLASMRLPVGDEAEVSPPGRRRSRSRLVRSQRRGGARGVYRAQR